MSVTMDAAYAPLADQASGAFDGAGRLTLEAGRHATRLATSTGTEANPAPVA